MATEHRIKGFRWYTNISPEALDVFTLASEYYGNIPIIFDKRCFHPDGYAIAGYSVFVLETTDMSGFQDMLKLVGEAIGYEW